MKSESFEKKLYIVRDIEGAPNYQELKMIRQLEERLAKDESFVGIAPFGSVVGGYSTEKSDLDLYVLYDNPDITKIDDLGKDVDVWEQEMKEAGRKAQVLFENINSELVIQELREGAAYDNFGLVARKLAEMIRVVTGKKIEHYRKIISAELNTLTPEQKNELAEEVVDSIIRREQLGLRKKKERMSELSEADHQKIMDERTKMWRKRVQKIWNI